MLNCPNAYPFKNENQPELCLKIKYVPRSKHTPSRLRNPVNAL
jgi:hypothetical protein